MYIDIIRELGEQVEQLKRDNAHLRQIIDKLQYSTAQKFKDDILKAHEAEKKRNEEHDER